MKRMMERSNSKVLVVLLLLVSSWTSVIAGEEFYPIAWSKVLSNFSRHYIIQQHRPPSIDTITPIFALLLSHNITLVFFCNTKFYSL